MAKRDIIPIEELRELLDYDPGTGLFFWKTRDASKFKAADPIRICKAWNSRHAGKQAVANATSYAYLAISGFQLRAHRVAWAIHYGKYPEGVIDHINGILNDNRIANLRDVPQGENCKNTSISRANKSGVVGVHWSTTYSRWLASIKVNKKTLFLGYHGTFEDAVRVRKDAERRFGFHANHGRAALAKHNLEIVTKGDG